MILIFCSSCYYYKVTNNKNEFNAIIDHIHKNNLLKPVDPLFLDKCLYNSDKQNDSIITTFMNKFDLDRICMDKGNDNYYDSVIIFHKDYNPIIGNAKTIEYDFGKSPIRKAINTNSLKNTKGIKINKGEKYKIIDSVFIYFVDRHPAFGQ